MRCHHVKGFSIPVYALSYLLILFTGCRQEDLSVSPADSLSLVQPFTYPAKTQEKYLLNPVFGDTVSWVVNSMGDTVVTGKPISIRPRRIPPEMRSPPKSVRAGKPRIKAAYTNVYSLPEYTKAISVTISELEQFVQDTEKTRYWLLNPVGDTIPTGVPITTKERVTPYACVPPTPAGLAQKRYDANQNIRNLSIEQGLNQSYVSSLVQDLQGHLWIGMYGAAGISRYDGSYFYNSHNKLGLPNQFINDALLDRKGNLWFATTYGFSRFNGVQFFSVRTEEGLANSWLSCLYEDSNGKIWVGSQGRGLLCYTPPAEGHDGTMIYYTRSEGLKDHIIHTISQDRNGSLWLGTRTNGVIRYDPPSQNKGGISVMLTTKTGLPDNEVLSLLIDRNGTIWIGTAKGICRYHPSEDGNEGKIYTFPLQEDMPSLPINALYEDQAGNIWCGTGGRGAYRITSKIVNGTTREMITHFGTREGLANNIVTSIQEDTNGTIWLGTEGGGVCMIKPRTFIYLTDQEGFTSYPVNAIFEDNLGRIWLGTHGDGLFVFANGSKDQTPTFSQYTTATGLPDNYISSITQDPYGNMWFGTSRTSVLGSPITGISYTDGAGLCRFDGQTFTTYTIKEGLTSNTINDLACDHKGNIWVGTGQGLSVIVLNQHADHGALDFLQYTEKQGLLKNLTSALCIDSRGHIWIGTITGGLSHLRISADGMNGEITHYTQPEGMVFRNILCLEEDNHQQIWVGTGSGLLSFTSPGEGLIDSFTYHGTRKQGLFSDNIRSIAEARNGAIWAGTLRGIKLIAGAHQMDSTYKMVLFKKMDGASGDEYMLKSSMVSTKNQLWLAPRSGGVEILDVNSFRMPKPVPTPVLRQLKISDVFYDFRNLPDSLRKEIVFDSVPPFENVPQGLVLPYKANHLTFHYSATDLLSPHKLQYRFRMTPVDRSWNNPTNETKVEYRNLSPGSYTFQLSAFDESQQWTAPYSFHFEIRPPWWYSWWAYLVYGLIGTTMLFGAYQYQLKRRLALADQQRLIELDQLKTRMYTNITHEFRTPLTLIHGPVSQALSSNKTLDAKDIQSIYRQSERLQQLINQMLELQKLESGKLKPNFEYGEIIQFIRYLFNSFELWSKEKNISLIISSPLQEVFMDFDPEKLTQIMTNLVSNAIKHTPRNGKVILILQTSSSADLLNIQIQDTGVGISPEDLPYIFDRYYQSHRAASGGTGIGLALAKNLSELLGGTLTVESALDVGSTFTLSLPITRQSAKSIHTIPKPVVLLPEPPEDENLFPSPEQPLSGKPIVLLVEDHPEIAQYVASCLAPEYIVLSAMNGSEGIQMAYEHIPDLVISDVMMPGMDGFDLTTALKKDIRTSHIPVILLTGRGDHDALMSGIERGADAYVTKPFDPPELLLRAKKLLELRANLRQYYRQHTQTDNHEAPVHVSAKENEFMKKLRMVVEEHLNDAQFNMNLLSKHMAMSHPQLHRKITALTGESTGKFVRSVRLTKAIELLKNSDLTISEIAYETGFSEPGYFTKIFSKEYHMSPSEYRNNLP